jgi:hypothetical protein
MIEKAEVCQSSPGEGLNYAECCHEHYVSLFHETECIVADWGRRQVGECCDPSVDEIGRSVSGALVNKDAQGVRASFSDQASHHWYRQSTVRFDDVNTILAQLLYDVRDLLN